MVARIVLLIIILVLALGHGIYRIAGKTVVPVFNNWCADQDRRAEQKRKKAEQEQKERELAQAEYERLFNEFKTDDDDDDESVNA